MWESIIVGVLMVVVTGWLGSVEFRMRQIMNELNTKAKNSDVKQYVDLKYELSSKDSSELKEDIHRIEKKVDRLIELNCKK